MKNLNISSVSSVRRLEEIIYSSSILRGLTDVISMINNMINSRIAFNFSLVIFIVTLPCKKNYHLNVGPN